MISQNDLGIGIIKYNSILYIHELYMYNMYVCILCITKLDGAKAVFLKLFCLAAH